MFGSSSALESAALICSTTSFDVSIGANRALHALTWYSGILACLVVARVSRLHVRARLRIKTKRSFAAVVSASFSRRPQGG